MIARLAVLIALAAGADAFTPSAPLSALSSPFSGTSVSPRCMYHSTIAAPIEGRGSGLVRGRAPLQLRMSDKDGTIGKIVSDVEMKNALNPNKSLPERIEATLGELVFLADQIEADVIQAEEQLAEKKNSLSLLKKRILMLEDDLVEARGDIIIEQTAVRPALIVGGGRVGSLLREIGHPDDVIVRSTIEYKYQLKEHVANAPVDGPIYLCVPTEEVPEIVEATPAERKNDLVFMGDEGHKAIKQHEEGTMASIFFMIDKTDSPPQDPGGMTVVSGKWAGDFASRLRRAGITARIGTPEHLGVAQLEYIVWLCAAHAVGKLHGHAWVQQVEENHGEDLEAMLRELGSAGEKATGIQLSENYVQKLREYTAGMKARVVVKAPRHELFWGISQEAKKAKTEDPCPLHTSALKKLKVRIG